MASNDTIEIYAGEDVTLPFENNVAVTGWAILLSVRSSSGVQLTKEAAITDGPAGFYQFVLDDSDTSLTPGTHLYDVWRTDAGSERVLAIGSFVVNAVAREKV
jgi:hypothetical protein